MIARNLGNVLESVTVNEHPVIDRIKNEMSECGALAALMSGSGPTVFGLFENETDAKKAYERLKAERLAKQIYLTGFVRRKRRPEDNNAGL
jgi:4-diphosphocytidyl-2-C-methyl-D-erythritol kinase